MSERALVLELGHTQRGKG